MMAENQRKSFSALTNDERKAALDKAIEIRRTLAQAKKDLKSGKRSAEDVLNDKTCESMRAYHFIKSLPGIGKVHAEQVMKEVGINEHRRLKGLGTNQRTKLLEIAAEYAH